MVIGFAMFVNTIFGNPRDLLETGAASGPYQPSAKLAMRDETELISIYPEQFEENRNNI